ncbi:MAG TPA: hypothetical protein VJQ84_05675 [Solirubrobacterales bacterium]|nr:hypothetical protein [Solirubrobacterales bacterium]
MSFYRRLSAALLALIAVLAFSAAGASAKNMLIWGNAGADTLSYANLDGSGGGDLGLGGATVEEPMGVAVDLAAGRIYWIEDPADAIRFGNLDGSGSVGTLSIAGTELSGGQGLSLDKAAGRIYWDSDEKIWFANLDGSGGGEIPAGGATLVGPQGVAPDPANGRIYWANTYEPMAPISSARLDGSGEGEDIEGGIAGTSLASGLALDPGASRVYWSSFGDNSIGVANLDGSGGEDLPTGTATIVQPQGLAVDPIGGKTYWTNWEGGGPQIGYTSLDGSGAGGDLNSSGAAVGSPDLPNHPIVLRAPEALASPQLSGRPVIGQPLTCVAATWPTDIPGAQLYQAPQTEGIEWTRDGATVPGALGASFTPSSGGTYACRAFASNFAGTGTATSAAFVVPPAGASLPSGFHLGKLVKERKEGTAILKVTVGSAGTVVLKGHGVKRVKARPKGATTLKLAVKPQGEARKKLLESGKAKLKLVVTFAPRGGAPMVKRKTVTLIRTARER